MYAIPEVVITIIIGDNKCLRKRKREEGEIIDMNITID